MGRSRLPQFQHILSYFKAPDFVKEFSVEEIPKVVEACLSSSYFDTSMWKWRVLTTAENIIRGAGRNNELWARVALRKRVLSRTFSDESWGDICMTDVIQQAFIPCDARFNARFGEVLLSNAQDKINCGDLDEALFELNQFMPLNQARPSTLEYNVMDSITFLRGKIDRFKGNFSEASKKLEAFLHNSRNGIIYKAMVHLISVYSELGLSERAIQCANMEVKACQTEGSLQHGQGRSLRLALAEAYLMKVIHCLSSQITRHATVMTALSNHSQSLKWAKHHYEQVLQSYQAMQKLGKVARTKCFCVLAGLAIISQLEDRPEIALAKWDAAADALKRCGWKVGFADGIVKMSKSRLQSQMSNFEEAERLAASAKDIFHQTGRQHYLTGLGSVWFDLIDDPTHLSVIKRYSSCTTVS